MPPKTNYPCIKCDAHVAKTASAVQCIFCDLWIHQKCANMTDEHYKQLVDAKETFGHCVYMCKSCHISQKKTNSALNALDKRVTAVEEKNAAQDNEIAAVKTQVNDIKKHVDEFGKNKDKSRQESEFAVYQELRDREGRKSNVVIHSLLEPGADIVEPEARKSKDMDGLAGLFSEIGATVDVKRDVMFAKRLGARGEGARPLLVGFNNMESRDSVLDKAKNLADMDEDMQRISIIRDLTQKQRDEEEWLRTEAERKNGLLSPDDAENWMWRVVGPRGQRRLIKARRDESLDNRGI